MQQQQNINPDLVYDDYYDEELDTEEADAYQQMINMSGGAIPPGAQQAVMIDPSLQPAQQLIGEGFEIMEEELDEDYEPTSDEIEEYAKYLGMDMNEDRDLFYIAKEGLKAPLPDPWKPCRSPQGSIYYFNFESQELQKEHPCDDYYKKYYINEKGNKRRKKEEKIIKQQIKQQQKQMLSTSMGSTGQANPTGSANAAQNTSLQQMLLMNMSGLDASTSVVNERVQLELEQLMEEYEDKKIAYERQKRDEIKKLEAEAKANKTKISEETKQEVESLKKQMLKSQQQDKDLRIQSRKSQLQIDKDKKVHELKESERQRGLKMERQVTTRFDKKKDDFKKEEEMRHKLEQDNLKQKYATKLKIEKEKIYEDNNRLLEESGDIDYQVRLFKSDLLQSQVETQKYELEDEMRKKLNEFKSEHSKRLDKERERIEQELAQKLEREREKEMRKIKAEKTRIEDKKEEMKRDMQNRLREEKRQLEKTFNDNMRRKKLDYDEDLERQRDEVKRSVVQTFELREERFEKEQAKKREEKKLAQEKYEDQAKSRFEEEKVDLEREFIDSFQKEKQDYQKQENERSETYQQIIRDISQSKNKLKEAQSKQQVMLRELKQRQRECEDLELEKRGKERQLKAKAAGQNAAGADQSTELLEKQLQREVREKNEELERLKTMIRDKKLDIELSKKGGSRAAIDPDDELQYLRLTKEIDTIKLMIKQMQLEADKQPDKGEQAQQKAGYVRKQRRQQQPVYTEYAMSEVQAYIELHLPKIKFKREKYENDRVILRQLIANIDRNRIKIRKDLLENNQESNTLSHQRRVAISGIKDKIDEQARILEEEEQKLKDKCDYYRRKEEKLRVIKQKVDIVEGKNRFAMEDMEDDDGEEDKKDALMRDIQIDYDKYLKLYQKESRDTLGLPSAQSKASVRTHELLALQHKWSDYLVDEVHELKPTLGFDHYQRPQQLFKPYSLHQKYELSDVAYKSKVVAFHVYDREFQNIRESRSNMKRFLDNQQQWLTNLRQEITYMGASAGGGYGYGQRGMINVGSNETLFQLKNNLSQALLMEHY